MAQQAPYVPHLDPSQPQSAPAPATAAPNTSRCLLARLRRDDSGQDLIEYALTAAMIGLTVVSGMNGLANNIASSFNSIGTAVANAIPADSGSSGTSGNQSDGSGHDHGDH